MQAGKLNRRVTLQRPVETRGDDGGIIRTWEDVDTVWARVEPISGKEVKEGDAEVNRATIKVTMRYYAGIDTTWRISL